MSRLASLQDEFQAYILAGDERALAHVRSASPGEACSRLGIYSHAYRQRLREVLRTDFPGLHAMAGDQLFEAIADAYIDTHCSSTPNARWFGAHLAGFIEASGDALPHGAILAEMASFEWAVGLAFDAPDEACLSRAQLAAMSRERVAGLRLRIARHVQRMNLASNVPAIWKAADARGALPELELSEAPSPWLIYRRGLATHFRMLEADEAAALDAIGAAGTFVAACERLLTLLEAGEAPARAAELLGRWAGHGLVVPEMAMDEPDEGR